MRVFRHIYVNKEYGTRLLYAIMPMNLRDL